MLTAPDNHINGENLMEMDQTQLKDMGINPKSDNHLPKPAMADTSDLTLAGQTWVITGTLSQDRGAFKQLIESKGGKVSGSISAKAHYLFCGDGGGSKRDKAEKLGVAILSEEEARALID